ncbi:preprotein translocase subunit SecE [Parapedomonas caeni]
MASGSGTEAGRPKVSPGDFVRQVRQETRKVAWPTRRETMVTTIMVFILTTVLALFFLGVDWVLASIVKWLVNLG